MSEIRRMGYILTGLLGLTVLTAFIWKPAPPAKFNGIAGSELPMTIGSFTAINVPVDAQTRAAIPSADIIQRQYTDPRGFSVNVTVIGGTGRNQLHDPRSCLVGAGWQIQDDHVEDLPDSDKTPARACEIAIDEPQSNQTIGQQNAEDMFYMYVVNRRIVASASSIRWTLLSSDLLDQNNLPVYFVRTYTDLPAFTRNSTANAAEHRKLSRFTAALWNQLAPAIDKGERS